MKKNENNAGCNETKDNGNIEVKKEFLIKL
jgi:hypothetical protein